MGVGSTPFFLPKSLPLPCILTEHFTSHCFLVTPVCPVPLLGCNILTHLGATLSFFPINSSDIHFFLPLVASRALIPDSSVPDFAEPVDPQVWNISTLVE